MGSWIKTLAKTRTVAGTVTIGYLANTCPVIAQQRNAKVLANAKAKTWA